MSVPSPCTRACRIDVDAGHCAGCGRTLAEICAWISLTDAERRAVLERVERRGRGATAPPRPPG